MKSNAQVYLSPDAKIRGHWMNADPTNRGWPSEGGFISITDNDFQSGVTIYFDREQLVRLRDVVTETIAGMPTAGSGLDGHEVVSAGRL